MTCKGCEHNYNDIHCCIMQNMSEYQYKKCPSWQQKIVRTPEPKFVVHTLEKEAVKTEMFKK